MKTDPPPAPEEKAEEAVARLEAEIAELRQRLRAAHEEEEKLEEKLEPLRRRMARR